MALFHSSALTLKDFERGPYLYILELFCPKIQLNELQPKRKKIIYRFGRLIKYIFTNYYSYPTKNKNKNQ